MRSNFQSDLKSCPGMLMSAVNYVITSEVSPQFFGQTHWYFHPPTIPNMMMSFPLEVLQNCNLETGSPTTSQLTSVQKASCKIRGSPSPSGGPVTLLGILQGADCLFNLQGDFPAGCHFLVPLIARGKECQTLATLPGPQVPLALILQQQL